MQIRKFLFWIILMPSNQAIKHATAAPFDTLLGVYDGVKIYSSDYNKVDKSKYPNWNSYKNYESNIFTGFRWQCVELARRYLLLTKKLTFADVSMAYDIFNLTFLSNPMTGEKHPLNGYLNHYLVRPQVGSILIWKEGGGYEHTGHVAIITQVHEDHVTIIEQNVLDSIWPPGQDYSRRLDAKVSLDGTYSIHDNWFPGSEILGWMNLESSYTCKKYNSDGLDLKYTVPNRCTNCKIS
jgi:glutathionylspermidine amidase/synthetase